MRDLIKLLRDIEANSAINKMNTISLAICLAPSVCGIGNKRHFGRFKNIIYS